MKARVAYWLGLHSGRGSRVAKLRIPWSFLNIPRMVKGYMDMRPWGPSGFLKRVKRVLRPYIAFTSQQANKPTRTGHIEPSIFSR